MKIADYDFDAYTGTFEKLDRYLSTLASEFPDYLRRSEIGKSREGRGLILMTLTDFLHGSAEDKPALLVFGNIHSHELSGPLACIETIRGFLEMKPDILKNRTLYLIPRINPDGAEKVMKMSHYIRSRWDYFHRTNTFHQADVDGDGISMLMRQRCPWGNWVVDPKDAQNMIPRTADSPGPCYRLFNEGEFENWDGETTEDSEWEGILRDWNRNWPCGWDPTREFCGDFPCCEPESHALALFVASRKNIFGVVDYHNGTGTILTPNHIDDADEKVYHGILQRASELIGYKLFQAPDEMKFRRAVSCGSKGNGYTDDHFYRNYGLLALTIELGTVEDSAGVHAEEIMDHDYPSDVDNIPAVMTWQEAHPDERRAFYEWRPFNHPQFGKIEIGGFDTIRLATPGTELLNKVFAGCFQFTMEFLRKGPEMKIVDEEILNLGNGVYRVRLRLQNSGELDTAVSHIGRGSAWRTEPVLDLHTASGVECLTYQKVCHPGHLGPWQTRMLEWFFLVKEESHDGHLGDLVIDGGAAGNLVYSIKLNKVLSKIK